jgi:nicotinate phosphoribosyltransferase
VYSDRINFPYAIELYRQFGDQIKTSFGIGTAITNDVGIVAPQIVLKMTHCNGRPVAKISDSTGKSMCPDENYVRYLREQFGVI